MLINKFLDKVRPIHFCSLLSDFRIPLTNQGFKSDKNICSSIALILCVLSQWLARFSRKRSTDFANKLGRHFIETHLGTLRVIRLFINL